MGKDEPLHRVGKNVVDVKFWVIGTFLATLGYGIVLSLFLAYLHDYLKSKRTTSCEAGEAKSSRRANFNYGQHLLLAFVCAMFCLSTVSFVAAIVATMNLLFPPENPSSNALAAFVLFGEASALVFASWGSDGLMIWRCLVLYQDTTKNKHIILAAVLSLLSLFSLGSGLAFIITARTLYNTYMPAFAAASTVMNIVITVLIVAWLGYHRRFIEKTFNSTHTFSYTRLIHIFVESAGLVVIFSITHLALIPAPNKTLLIPHHLLTQVYVISSFLILFRVASEKSHPSSASEEQGTVLSTNIRFSLASFLSQAPSESDQWTLTPVQSRQAEIVQKSSPEL